MPFPNHKQMTTEKQETVASCSYQSQPGLRAATPWESLFMNTIWCRCQWFFSPLLLFLQTSFLSVWSVVPLWITDSPTVNSDIFSSGGFIQKRVNIQRTNIIPVSLTVSQWLMPMLSVRLEGSNESQCSSQADCWEMIDDSRSAHLHAVPRPCQKWISCTFRVFKRVNCSSVKFKGVITGSVKKTLKKYIFTPTITCIDMNHYLADTHCLSTG